MGGEGGQNVPTSHYKIVSPGCVMHSMGTKINNAVVHIKVEKQIKNSHKIF